MWAEAVELARAHHREAHLPAGLERLAGGFNNGVYGVGDMCVKLYRVDDRRRWEREWCALKFLAKRGLELAPRPLHYDPDGSPPAIVMERLPGKPLAVHRLGPAELAVLAEATAALHEIPDARNYPTTVVGTPAMFVQQVTLAADRLPTLPNDPLAARSAAYLQAWLLSDDGAILAEPAPTVFSRGDANPANCLWDGSRLRFVDLEYAGRSDLAFDLGDTLEHIGAQMVAEARWAPFVDRFRLDTAGQRRFRAARRLAANFTLTILWRPAMDRPEARIETQLRRVEHVLRVTQ